MNCNDTNLSAYLDHELPATERRAVEAHLRFCPDCAATLKDLERVRTMLLTQAIPMGLHGPVIDRIRKEEHTSRSTWPFYAVAATVVALVAVAAYTAIYRLNAPNPGGPPHSDAPIAVVSPDRSEGADRFVFADNTSPPDSAPATATTRPIQETSLPLILTGTLLGGDPQAVLKNNDTGEQHIYRPGEAVLEGVVLREVQQSRVILENNGALESLNKGPGVIATRPRLDGRWQIAMVVDDKVVDYGEVLTLKETGGIVQVNNGDSAAYAEARVDGNTLIVTRMEQNQELGALRGTFNDSFTEVVLKSPELTKSLAEDLGQQNTQGHTYAVKLMRVDENSPTRDPRAVLEARLAEVREMYPPLRAYADAHDGQFPAALSMLVPDYVQSTDLFASRSDRTVTYMSGLELQQLGSTSATPNCATAPDPTQALLAHEAELQRMWGGPAPFIPTLIEVSYSDPYQLVTLSVQGNTGSSSAYDEPTADASDATAFEVRWSAMIASDQNNLKQLGLVNKMFQNENCDYVIPGFCTVYPEYLTDTNILTSPWDAPGTMSYELLFPAVHQEDLEVFAARMLDPAVADPEQNPAFHAIAQSTVPLIYNVEDIPAVGGKPATRNVLFLDGHVERMTIPDFNKRVGPFLR